MGNSSLLTQVDLPNGEKSTFTYDALERLTQVQNLTNAGANISQYSYAYDNTTHLPGRVSETSQVGTDASIVRNYGYDPVSQLISETVTQNGQTTQSKSYAYDPMGNRTQQTYQYGSDPLHTVSYTNNSLNQTSGVSDADGTAITQSAITYDANGNMTQVNSDNSSTEYSYDDADRLSAIVYKNDQGVNVSKSTFIYDGLNRLRISRQYNWDAGTSAWNQQSEKRRIYDGMDVVQERDGNNAVTNSYTRNGNIGGILAMVHYTPDGAGGFTSQKYFYHYDGRGNVTQLTNTSQNIVAQYNYDAFGNTTASGAAAGLNAYRFSTKEQIGGLYYYGYRFYSPGMGKWINRDPIEEAGGLNLYGFVGNGPVNAVDEYGLLTPADLIAATLAGFIAGAAAQLAAQAFTNLLSGKDWNYCLDYKAILASAIAGAVTALGVALMSPGLAQIIGGKVLGAAVAAVNYYETTPSFNADDFAAAVLVGAASGSLSGAAGSVTSISGAGIGSGVTGALAGLVDAAPLGQTGGCD